jgi:hypothetical protein
MTVLLDALESEHLEAIPGGYQAKTTLYGDEGMLTVSTRLTAQAKVRLVEATFKHPSDPEQSVAVFLVGEEIPEWYGD